MSEDSQPSIQDSARDAASGMQRFRRLYADYLQAWRRRVASGLRGATQQELPASDNLPPPSRMALPQPSVFAGFATPTDTSDIVIDESDVVDQNDGSMTASDVVDSNDSSMDGADLSAGDITINMIEESPGTGFDPERLSQLLTQIRSSASQFATSMADAADAAARLSVRSIRDHRSNNVITRHRHGPECARGRYLCCLHMEDAELRVMRHWPRGFRVTAADTAHRDRVELWYHELLVEILDIPGEDMFRSGFVAWCNESPTHWITARQLCGHPARPLAITIEGTYSAVFENPVINTHSPMYAAAQRCDEPPPAPTSGSRVVVVE